MSDFHPFLEVESEAVMESIQTDVEKDRRYIDDPSEAPEDAEVQEGPQGGLYYETEGEEGEEGEEPEYSEEMRMGFINEHPQLFSMITHLNSKFGPKITHAFLRNAADVLGHIEPQHVQDATTLFLSDDDNPNPDIGIKNKVEGRAMALALEKEFPYLKDRVYIDNPNEAPEDVEVEEGEHGGLYYETEETEEDTDVEPDEISFEEMGSLLGEAFGEDFVNDLVDQLPEDVEEETVISTAVEEARQSEEISDEELQTFFDNLGQAAGSELGPDEDEEAVDPEEVGMEIPGPLDIDDVVGIVADEVSERAAYALLGDMRAPDTGEAPNPDAYVAQAAYKLPQESRDRIQDRIQEAVEEGDEDEEEEGVPADEIISEVGLEDMEDVEEVITRGITEGSDLEELAGRISEEKGDRYINRVLNDVEQSITKEIEGYDSPAKMVYTWEDDPEFPTEAEEKFKEAVDDDVAEIAQNSLETWPLDFFSEDMAPLWKTVMDETGNSNLLRVEEEVTDTEVTEEEKKAIRAHKSHVEETLREVYGDTITVYRGVYGDAGGKLQEASENEEEVEWERRAVESYTTELSYAKSYAQNPNGVVVEQEVPVEDVWASSYTGFLDANENELVIQNDEVETISPENIHTPDTLDDGEWNIEEVGEQARDFLQ